MSDEIKKKIETSFRNLDNFDELFDSFRFALEQGIKDFEIYRMLLANRCLKIHEIELFVNKLCEVCPENRYDIYMWVAEIFFGGINTSNDLKAFEYYKLANQIKPASDKPLQRMLYIYNEDIELETNELVLDYVIERVKLVGDKAYIYDDLSEIYKKKGDIDKYREFSRLRDESIKH